MKRSPHLHMKRSQHLYAGGIALSLAMLLVGIASRDVAGQRPTVATDADDIGGVVTGPRGPEAGVWVIAETTNLPTKFIRIVVTDDQGRFLVPDLPKASYNVWARGYGLVDSSKTQAQPGQMLNLMATPAAQPDTASRRRLLQAGEVVPPRAAAIFARYPLAVPPNVLSPADRHGYRRVLVDHVIALRGLGLSGGLDARCGIYTAPEHNPDLGTALPTIPSFRPASPAARHAY